MVDETNIVTSKGNNSSIFIGIILGMIVMTVSWFLYSSYISIQEQENIQLKTINDLNKSLQDCSGAYYSDVNLLLSNGSIMKQHLAICRTSLDCMIDWNGCQIKDNINTYVQTCETNDNNILSLYNIFR